MTTPATSARWRGPLATLIWLAGITFCIAWGVGSLDQWAAPTQTGAALAATGLWLGPLLVVVSLVVKPRPGLTYKQLTAVAVGLWPFAAFGTFLYWQIGMSSEQLTRCDAGEARQCEILATRKERRGKFDEAAPLFGKGCELGALRSCHHYATMLRAGRGLPAANSAEALTLFTASCANDEALSCLFAGSMHKRGEAGPADTAQAQTFFARGCALGLASSCAEVELLTARAGDAEVR